MQPCFQICGFECGPVRRRQGGGRSLYMRRGSPTPWCAPPRPSPLSSTHRARSLRGAWGNPKLAKVGLRGPLGESVTLENGIPETRGMLQSPATGPSKLSSRRCKAAVLGGISFACNRVSRSVVSNAARCAGAREMGGPCPTSDPRSLVFCCKSWVTSAAEVWCPLRVRVVGHFVGRRLHPLWEQTTHNAFLNAEWICIMPEEQTHTWTLST